MRKLMWAGVVAAALGVVVVVLAAASLNRLIAGQRDRILARAQAALGREVAADRIAVNLWGGLGIRISTIRVGEDPRFRTADFLRADDVIVHTKLLPLLHGRVEIDRIELRRPQAQLIRDGSGQWNYASLGRTGGNTAGGPRADSGIPEVSAEQLPFIVGRANLENGSVEIIDRSRHPERTVHLTQIDLAVSDLKENMPVRFSLDAALDAPARNVHIRGSAGPWTPHSDMALRVDGALGPLGPRAVHVDDVHLEATVAPEHVSLSQINGRAFGGSFQLTGEYPLRSAGTAMLKGTLSDMALPQVLQLTMQDAPQRLSGSGQLQLDLRASGASADAMRASLAGQVAADVHDAVIKDFNIANEVLGRLTNLPKVGDLVSRRVKPKYARLFAEPDTRVRRLHATFQIADQRMHTDDLTVEANDFGVRAAGWVDFDRNMDMAGTLVMSKGFTQDVVADVKEAKYLADDQGQLAVPFHLRGKLGQARPEPDTAYLLARLSQAIAPGAVKDLVEKFFGGSAPQQRPATPKGAKPENPLEQRLRDLLGR